MGTCVALPLEDTCCGPACDDPVAFNRRLHTRVRELQAAIQSIEVILKVDPRIEDLARNYPVPPEPAWLATRQLSATRLLAETEDLERHIERLRAQYTVLNTALITVLYSPEKSQCEGVYRAIEDGSLFAY